MSLADHPNFTWGGQKKNASATKLNTPAKSAFQESIEDIFKELFTINESTSSKIAEALVSIAASPKTMENQLGKIHKVVSDRPVGSIPSYPEIAATMERKNEQVNSIELMSGKAIDSSEKEMKLIVNPKSKEEEVSS